MSASTADTLLSPNDKQDVVLMIKLLNTISKLAPALDTDTPSTKSTRRALILLGRVYHHLLNAYMDVQLSLHEQLVHLSAAAHLILAMYHTDKGEFIPVQTFFDVMSMIKNVYFCVAKIQVDDPTGSLWIISLGSDGLEKVFGKVRSMVGNDTNADQLQLTNRIDGAVQCVKILEIHPEWGGQSRRLNIKPLPSDATDISNKYDHINPKSWKGDVRVQNVVLGGSWSAGFRIAETELADAQFPSPFDNMKNAGGYDIMCPFGNGKMALVDGRLSAGERDETEEERDDPPVDELATPGSDDGTNIEPDLDDVAGAVELTELPTPQLPEAWISIDDSNPSKVKKVHKASILRLYSSPLTISDSKDRLKRVRGFSQYNESKSITDASSLPPLPSSEEEEMICVLDPALTLVRCNNKVFLAVFQVLGIRHDTADVQSLPCRFLGEPNVHIHGHIMKLGLIDGTPEPDKPDWEWNGGFEAHSGFRDIEGRWVELIDPQMQPASRGRNVGEDTYVFQTSDLRSISAMLYERVTNETHRLPSITLSDSFPYRSSIGMSFDILSIYSYMTLSKRCLGQACFVCESDGVDGTRQHDGAPTCSLCPNILIDSLSGPDLLKHMGAHILHDHKLYSRPSPCGFCLNSQCEIHLSRHGQFTTIDMQKSRCPNLRKVRLKIAESFTERQPCTNHPLKCPLCTLIVWKYNLRNHITDTHPNANAALYESLYRLHPSESTLMKGVFLAPTRSTKSKRSKAKALAISAGHSSRMALRYDSFSFILIYFLQQALHRTSEDSEDEDEIDSQGDEDVNRQDDEDINTQDEEVIAGPSELMEDSAAGNAMNEDFDYGVQRISESIAPETDADNEDLFDGPIGMISLYCWHSLF